MLRCYIPNKPPSDVDPADNYILSSKVFPGSADPAHVDLQQVTPPPGASVFSSISWDDDVAMRIR